MRSLIKLAWSKYLRPRILLLDRKADEEEEEEEDKVLKDCAAAMYQEGLSMVKGMQWYLEELCNWLDMTLPQLALAMHSDTMGDIYFLEAVCEHGIYQKYMSTREMRDAISMANLLANDRYTLFEDELVALEVEMTAESEDFDEESFLLLGRRSQPESYRKKVRAAMRMSKEQHAAMYPMSAFRAQDEAWVVPCRTTSTPFVYPMGIGHSEAWCYPPGDLYKRIFRLRTLLLKQTPG